MAVNSSYNWNISWLCFNLALCSHYLGNSTFGDVESGVEELRTGVESLLRDSDEEDLYEDSDDSGEEDLVFANITSEDSDSDGEEKIHRLMQEQPLAGHGT
ncbi:hypothetical protein KIN20_000473 [Parelaphostrongylus tenuis]|uniref:Uncharacterized protein n=1 Tax=Parelaphostrongylus tenuis TaxID=148309 RepID=A0AAD5QFL1_PARTN|nr:hypothetical protein KIN20_000473 [Parelaphostrongylus tenuis]